MLGGPETQVSWALVRGRLPMLTSELRAASFRASALATTIRRRELFIWLAAILAASHFFRIDAHSVTHLPEALVQAFTSRSVFHYLGWYAVFQLLADSNRSASASLTDIAFGLLAALLPFFPVHSLAWISTTALAVYLLATGRADSKVEAAAIVLLALAFNGLWAPQFFDVFALQLLRADTVIVGALLSLTQTGITWHNTIIASDAHSIVILAQCSSFHNISLSLLCWVSLTKLARTAWARGDILVALLVCVTVLFFNTIRLYYMALSPEQYAYWHTGFGAQLFAWTTPAAIIAISLWGAFRSGRPT